MRNCYWIIFLVFITAGCGKDKEQLPAATPYHLTIPRHFPQTLNIPADNPMTVEGIALGRYLFYDGHLSGRTQQDSLMSCGTCHIRENSFVCGINHPQFHGHPYGLTGNPTPHVMMPLINLVWNSNGYLWNGSVCKENSSAENIEDIVWMTITDPNEICGDTNRTKTLISSIPAYAPLFKNAFGSETVTMKNICRAIAQFVRTLVSANSKFDRFLNGEVQLDAHELKGYELFMTEEGADCFHCHGGDGNPVFTTNLFYNNGKDAVFQDPLDRFHFTGNAADEGSYKAPTLRNLVFRAPYMHDGRFTTLEQVIDFYSNGLVYSPSISPLMHHIDTRGVQLTPSKKADLKAFLLTLTDSSFVANPEFGRPAGW
ncbi:MAG: cytochrome-c peroxidase [Syntrophothermus sp.]